MRCNFFSSWYLHRLCYFCNCLEVVMLSNRTTYCDAPSYPSHLLYGCIQSNHWSNLQELSLDVFIKCWISNIIRVCKTHMVHLQCLGARAETWRIKSISKFLVISWFNFTVKIPHKMLVVNLIWWFEVIIVLPFY